MTPTLLVTAAHVLRSGLPEGGRYLARPFGSGGMSLHPDRFEFHPHLDIARIKVAGGQAAGIPVRAYADGDLTGRKVAVAGRPLDPASPPPPGEPLPSSGVVWFADLIGSVSASELEYANLSTLQSHSGAPVLALNEASDGYLAVGVHRADQSAVRITPAVRAWLHD